MKQDSVKVVGQSLKDGVGSITLQIPREQLAEYAEVQTLPFGTSASREMGARFGLQSQTQTLEVPDERVAQIQLARHLYTYEPIVATVIDLMVDFCLTGMENSSEDREAKEFFDKYCKYSDFDSLHREIFKDYFISGDLFPMRGRKRKVDYGPDAGHPFFEYTVVNPIFVEVKGSMVFGDSVIGIRPNDELKKMLRDPEMKSKLAVIPKGLRDAAEKGGIWVPPEGSISRISRKRMAYERYATPFLARIFEPALIKRRMREADVALAETVRYVLVTITTGNDEYPAKTEDLTKLAELFDTPAKSMELFWNHTLEVKFHFPDADLFGDEKYNQVNKDILQGLGFPAVLIDGGSGTFATAWVSLLSVIERLDAARDEVKRWQEKEYTSVAKALGLNFKDIPSVKFKPLNLRDDKVFKNLLLELWDRGILSHETLLSYSDFDLEVEVRNRMAEKEKLDPILTPRDSKDKGGRPNDKVDPGNYTDRDKVPDPDNDSPEQDTSYSK